MRQTTAGSAVPGRTRDVAPALAAELEDFAKWQASMAILKNMHKITVTMMPHREWRDLYLIAPRSGAAPGALGRLARAEVPAAHKAIAAAADATDLETRPAAGACEDLVAQGLDHRFCATGPLCGIHLVLSVRTRPSCATLL
jgi:hypothetical protein